MFEGSGDHTYLRRIQNIFFGDDKGPKSGTLRQKLRRERSYAALYTDLHIATVAVMRVRGWWLFFINNFPSSYRLVPRVFWNDGLEKLQVAKFLLDR